MPWDFNIHVNETTNSCASNFQVSLNCLIFHVRHVRGPTHIKGNTMDLVFPLPFEH